MAEIVTKPSARGFLRRYLGAASAFIASFLAGIVSEALSVYGLTAFTLAVIVAIIVLWVLRTREAGVSMLLWITAVLIYVFSKASRLRPEDIYRLGPRVVDVLVSDALSFMFYISIPITLVILILVELFRRSVRYVVGEDEVVIEGGIWRRQIQAIPYHMIGRIIIEQSLIGRALNYGTIILVSPALWGEELYARAVGVDVAYYARVLQEISRDPLKCLYGVPNPHEIASVIRDKIKIPFEAFKELEFFLKSGSESFDEKRD